MSINRSTFTDWPNLQPRAQVLAAHNHCSPTLVLIGEYLDQTYGTAYLGCFGVRDTRSGATLSTHSFGAAGDRSFRLVANGNQAEKRRIMLFAIEDLRLKSAEWGIQAIHDYMGCRIWRSNRDPKMYPDGWKIQPKDSDGMGQAWADWIHVEVHAGMYGVTTPLLERLGAPLPVPVRTRPVLGLPAPGVTSTGPLVKAVQEFLAAPPPYGANQAAFVGNPDGHWGPRTQSAWNNYVLWHAVAHPGAMTTDGNVDGIDWNLIAWDSGGWDRLLAAGFPAGV